MIAASRESTSTADISAYGAGDFWLVKSSNVSIQARYLGSDELPDSTLFVRAIAVGGEFLANHTMVIGSLEDQILWDGRPILQNQTSSFTAMAEDYFVKAKRSEHSSLVEDTSKENPGVNLEFPLGVSLVVNRLRRHVNLVIEMTPQKEGQDGLCGNFNGISADDTLEVSSKRFDPKVPVKESLFVGLSFDE